MSGISKGPGHHPADWTKEALVTNLHQADWTKEAVMTNHHSAKWSKEALMTNHDADRFCLQLKLPAVNSSPIQPNIGSLSFW